MPQRVRSMMIHGSPPRFVSRWFVMKSATTMPVRMARA